MEKNKYPILVPLYKSYHLLDRFIKCLELERKTDFEVYFGDNTEMSLAEAEDKIKEFYDNYGCEKYKMIVKLDENENPKRLWYSETVNHLFELAYTPHVDESKNFEFDKFVIMNPDCFPDEENWLTRMVEIWDNIYAIDNNIATLGTLQLYDDGSENVWHFGCYLKPENERGHPLDWRHNHHYNGQNYIKCDGNTGTGIMISKKIFEDLNMLDNVNHHHYGSDADFCERARNRGFTHYCSGVRMRHSPGNSSK